MKINQYKLAFLMLCLSFSSSGWLLAQHTHPCGTDEANRLMFERNPDAKKAREELEKFTKDFISSPKSAAPIYFIPVVFHILHEYGAENISDDQILDAMQILNNDYNKLNADTDDVVNAFKPIVADCQIEFRLAKIDPDGNCTNGIDRIVSPLTNIGDNDAKLNPWPRNKYLNIWVVKDIASGAAGYSQYPSGVQGPGGAAVDGIMVLSHYVGSIGTGSYSRSRTLTHEAGHWLNLAHCWGDSNSPGVSSNCSDDDNVSDTPNTIGWTSCNLTGSSCGSPLDNVQNYMEYSYCSRMFTNGQKARMHAALNSNTASRNNLSTQANLAATGVNLNPGPICVPTPDFTSNYTRVCEGTQVQFTDHSWNSTPTTWNWSFPGGNPSGSTDQNPLVTYASPGTYSVTLQSGNASGNGSVTKTSYIIVDAATPDITTGFLSESFESLTLSGSAWEVINDGGPAWSISSLSGYTGSKSMRLNNTSGSIGDVDEFITPSMNINGISSPRLYFRLAYAQLPNAPADENKLEVRVSTNCGSTWTIRKTLTGDFLATVPDQSNAFTPTAGSSQWRLEEVNLSSFANANNARFKFTFSRGSSPNNIYIDDINVSSPLGIDESQAFPGKALVYPNPADENSRLWVNLTVNQRMQIDLFDVYGKKIGQVFQGELMQGEHSIGLEKFSDLASGTYFIRLIGEDSSYSLRYLVK